MVHGRPLPLAKVAEGSAAELSDPLLLGRMCYPAAGEQKRQRTMNITTNRPPLREVCLASVWPPRRGRAYVTLSEGQAWDAVLDACYAIGWVLLELNDDEHPVRAYQWHTTAPAFAERN